MTTTGFGYPEEEQSLVGPPAGADASGQVGLAAPTAEEIEHEKQKLEAIQEELLKKDKLGLYTDRDLLEESGKKILVDKGNANIGIEPETGTPLVKHHSGAWLSPADTEYESTLRAVATEQASLASQQESDEQKKGTQAEHERQHEQQHERDVQQIQQMVAINEGSAKPHTSLDEAALQRVRQGTSTAEAKNLKNIVATLDGFAHIEATDINPEAQHLKPTHVAGPGVDMAMEAVRKRKEKENAQFEAAMKLRERDKDKKNG